MIVKPWSIFQILTALMLILSATATINPSRSYAQNSDQNSNGSTTKQVSFLCGDSNGTPTTIARTARGDIALIRWASGFFNGSGFTPQRRCQEVSNRFQTYYQNGTLKYLTTGKINNQPVICTAKTQSVSCTDVLLTLEPGDNANQVLRQLLSLRSGASNGPLSRSGSSTQKPLYINLDAYLDRAPIEAESSPVTQPSTESSPAPQPSPMSNSQSSLPNTLF